MPLSLDPPTAELTQGQANAFIRARDAMKASHWGEAFGIALDLIEGSPSLPGAHAILGTVLAVRRQWAGALASFDTALSHAETADWHARRAGALRELFRAEESVAAATRSVEIEPENPHYLINLGFSCIDTGELLTARLAFIKAIGIAPEMGEAHFALAQLLLREGEYAIGWREYEWRNKCEMARDTLPTMTSMEWNGINTFNDETRLVIIGDQGYGDTIMFARLLEEARKQWSGPITLGVSKELHPLFLKCPFVDQVCETWLDIPPHTCHARLSSLPAILGYQTNLYQGQYAWLAEEETNFTPPEATGTMIGISWRGRPAHASDLRRSLSVGEMMTAMAGNPRVTFVCLQADVTPEERTLLLQAFPQTIFPELKNWAQTTYIVRKLAHVITVDTAVAHLTGAIGTPGTILLYAPAEWRWAGAEHTTHLYPSLQLIRQKVAGKWEPTLQTLKDRLMKTVIHVQD